MNSEPPSDDSGAGQDPHEDLQADWPPPAGPQVDQQSPDGTNPSRQGTQDGVSPKSSTMSLSLTLPHRSSDDRYIAGVSGGLGRRFGFDPFFIRMVLLAATMWFSYNRSRGYDYYGGYGRVTGGTALVLGAYTLAWLIMPTDKGRSLVARLSAREGAQEAAAAVLCFVLSLVVIDNTDHIAPLLIAGVALLFLGGTRAPWSGNPTQAPDHLEGSESPESQVSAAARTAGEDRSNAVFAESGSVAPEARPRWFGGLAARRPNAVQPVWQRPAKPRSVGQGSLKHRREPALWPLAIGLLLIAAVIFAAADSTMDQGVRPGIAVNVALLIVGAVLVASRWKGRASVTWLLVLPLIPLWLGLSATSTPRFDGQGSVVFAPESVEDDLSFAHGYGYATLDLRHLELTPGSVTRVSLDMTAGSGSVWLPIEPDIELTIDSGLADVNSWTEDYYREGLVLGDSVKHSFSQAGWDAAHSSQECRYREVEYWELVDLTSKMTVAEQATPVPGYDTSDALGPRDLGSSPYLPAEVASVLRAVGYDVIDVSDPLSGPNRYGVLMTDQYLCGAGEAHQTDDVDTSNLEPVEPATLIVDVSIGLGSMEIIRG